MFKYRIVYRKDYVANSGLVTFYCLAKCIEDAKKQFVQEGHNEQIISVRRSK